jgi:DNA-binding NtrC family response regulator
MPQFDGMLALDLLRKRGLDIPFLLVSAQIGEDTAVEAVKRGADDYLLKDRPGRLGIAVKGGLERNRLRQDPDTSVTAR